MNRFRSMAKEVKSEKGKGKEDKATERKEEEGKERKEEEKEKG